VAEDKRKILENARKYAQKGAQEKALKEYQKLVKLDPKDAKLRLEIGDAYRRWGKNDEALSTYQKVADQYMREGFDARAVAVYKQILALTPDFHGAYEPLAELYERMGLTSEAISALQTAADGYHKQGKKREALELLRKMATIDPTNTASRIKVAELLRQEKLLAEAVSEYEQVAAELERQSDFDAAGNVYRRMLELEPQRDSALAAFGRVLLRQNKGPEAESVARRAIAANGEEPAYYELLADTFRAQNRDDLLADAYRPLVELYTRRGDNASARDITQRYLPQAELSADSDFGSLDGNDLSSPEPHPENARGLEATDDSLEGFGSDDIELDDELDTSSDEIELTHVAGDGEEAGDEPVIETPEGDPDQLFAEASVYLRYGKSDKAIAHLQAIVAQVPNHRGALEKLGEAYAERGDDARAVEMWTRAAKRAIADGASDSAAVLRDRIQALDPDAAAALMPPQAKAAPPKPVQVKVAAKPAAAPPPPPPPPKPAPAAAKPAAAKAAPPKQVAPEPEEHDIDIDVDVEVDDDVSLELDLSHGGDAPSEEAAPESVPETDIDLATAASDTGIEGASLSTATTQQILEDLEEADFYLEQGLMDEAEGLFKRVLAIAPNHPRALVRLGELSASRGGDPAGPGAAKPAAKAAPAKPAAKAAPPAPAKPAAAATKPAAAKKPVEPEIDIEIEESSLDISVDEEIPAVASAAAGAADDEIAAAFDVEGTATPEAAHDPNEDTPVAPDEPLVAARPAAPARVAARPAPAKAAPAKPAPAPPPPKPVAPPIAAARSDDTTTEEEAGDFDLAAELSDAFDDANGKSGIGGNVDFESVFAAFKKGVSETLDASDYEAHYDLGIAYKEMGLYPDAIAEFRTAMGNRAREIECLHLIGLCGLESGDTGMAIEHLERLLGRTGLPKEQMLAARFDLGRALIKADRRDEARTAFLAVAALDPDFQDVAAQLKAIDKPKGKAHGDASDPASFESFDDVIGEASDDGENQRDAKGESFDDLFAEDADDSASGPVVIEKEEKAWELEQDEKDQWELEPGRDPDPEAGSEPTPPPRRPAAKPAPAPSGGAGSKKKKKISFL
jgi:tetratricopeptide (TPR) repeat protein